MRTPIRVGRGNLAALALAALGGGMGFLPLTGRGPSPYNPFTGAGVDGGRGLLQLTGRERKPRDRTKPRPSKGAIRRARQRAQRLARRATRKAHAR